MRVVAISVVKNEVDIVEAFVRHNLASVDRLIVMDNGSTDGTREILQRLVDEGLPLEVLEDPSPGHYLWRQLTYLMREHALQRCHADWVVPLDADEFLCGPDLKGLLADAGDRPFSLYWRTYVPDTGDAQEETNPVRRIRQRLKKEFRPCRKIVVPAALGRRPGVVLDQGSHNLLVGGVAVPPILDSDGLLAHFPGRSPDQFASKIAMKHMQYLAMTERSIAWGFHSQGPAALLRQDRRRFDAGFRDMILRFNLHDGESFTPELVVDPLPYRGGELRYEQPNAGDHLFVNLWDYTAGLASRHARLQAEIAERDAVIGALQGALQCSRMVRWFWVLRAGLVVPAYWTRYWFRRQQPIKRLRLALGSFIRWTKGGLRAIVARMEKYPIKLPDGADAKNDAHLHVS